MLIEALARIAELQHAIARIDAALEDAGMYWLIATPSLDLDSIYLEGCALLEDVRASLQREIAIVRMGALL